MVTCDACQNQIDSFVVLESLVDEVQVNNQRWQDLLRTGLDHLSNEFNTLRDEFNNEIILQYSKLADQILRTSPAISTQLFLEVGDANRTKSSIQHHQPKERAVFEKRTLEEFATVGAKNYLDVNPAAVPSMNQLAIGRTFFHQISVCPGCGLVMQRHIGLTHSWKPFSNEGSMNFKGTIGEFQKEHMAPILEQGREYLSQARTRLSAFEKRAAALQKKYLQDVKKAKKEEKLREIEELETKLRNLKSPSDDDEV
jgi:hypothetical protein